MSKFGKQYYQTGNYFDYLQRAAKYQALSLDLVPFLSSPVLDYGCGVGFLVNGLCEQGVDCQGYDISSWAIAYGKKTLEIQSLTDQWQEIAPCETLIALDVFEHLSLEGVRDVLGAFNPQILIVRIPVTAKAGGDFVLEISRRDTTHITCLTKAEWERFFSDNGYDLGFIFQFKTIWDSDGVLSRMYVKNSTSKK